MKALRFKLLLLLCFLATNAVATELTYDLISNSKDIVYSKYKTKNGDTIASILRRLNIKPIWGSNGFVKTMVKINPESIFIDKLNKIRADVVIKIPIVDKHPRYHYDDKGYIILAPLSEVKRGVASNKVDYEKIEILKLRYACAKADDPKIYKMLSELINVNAGLINKVNVDFACDNIEPYELLPWLDTAKTKDPRHKNHFWFLSLGQGEVDYKEGAFSTGFSHKFINLGYRNLIGKSDWLVDAQVLHSLSSKPDEIPQADPKMFNADLRLGKTFSSVFEEPWSFSLYAGVYYTQMLVEHDIYGYKGTYYPQIYPEFRRVFKDGDALSLFFKYVPTSLEGNQRSLESGFTYYMRGFKLPLRFNFHYMDFQFFSESGNKEINIEQVNFSIGVGF